MHIGVKCQWQHEGLLPVVDRCASGKQVTALVSHRNRYTAIRPCNGCRMQRQKYASKENATFNNKGRARLGASDRHVVCLFSRTIYVFERWHCLKPSGLVSHRNRYTASHAIRPCNGCRMQRQKYASQENATFNNKGHYPGVCYFSKCTMECARTIDWSCP
jgi:hypothetical protein